MVVEEPDIEIGAGVSSKGKLPLSIFIESLANQLFYSHQQTHCNRHWGQAGTSLFSYSAGSLPSPRT